jgi:hypothetical protein
VNLFSDYNLSLNLKHMKMKSEKGGALLLAIALSGEVAAQTKDASRSVHCKQCQRKVQFRNWRQ